MAKIDVCIETVFPELPFIERIKKVAQLGFQAIEFWFCDEKDKDFKGTISSIEERTGSFPLTTFRMSLICATLVHNFINTMTYYLLTKWLNFGILSSKTENRRKYAEKKPISYCTNEGRERKTGINSSEIYVSVLSCSSYQNCFVGSQGN